MNYANIYRNSERRLKEAILSLWTSGNPKNRAYIERILTEERLLAEPVFQSNFPWESSPNNFDQHDNIFDRSFINNISDVSKFDNPKEAFPKTRFPHKHQSDSWKELLINNNSIVVTTGTGSGKTECFMLPVLQDLVRQRQINPAEEGVQAIFLYPLNALMGSQQKRLSAWCKALSPKISFALYNGNTKDDVNQSTADARYPEIVDRNRIRKNPPQILFTNPTMLEYMLVRKQDQDILNKSQGKLRWIILDETHTYSGSSAAELSLQIKRILDAFGVSINDVRIVATSATISSDGDDGIKQFVSDLSGKPKNQIAIIKGNRTIPKLASKQTTSEILKWIDQEFPESAVTESKLISLRSALNHSAMAAGQITDYLGINNVPIVQSLRLLDYLCDYKEVNPNSNESTSYLSTRAHYFARSIGGLFVCVNPSCEKHVDHRLNIGVITSYVAIKCDCCKSQLVELVMCSSCGNLLLETETDLAANIPRPFRMKSKVNEELFAASDLFTKDEDEEVEDTGGPKPNQSVWALTYLAKGVISPPTTNTTLRSYNINFTEGYLEEGEGYSECINTSTHAKVCPHCAEETDDVIHFRTSANFSSRVLSATFLEEASPMASRTTGQLWEGRKYIAFTDSRQGTAKSALAQNVDTERNWIRTAVFHYLSDKRRAESVNARDLTDEEKQIYQVFNAMRATNRMAEEKCLELEGLKVGNKVNNPQPLSAVKESLISNKDLGILYKHLGLPGNAINNYLSALFIDQFGRRPRRGNSPETMGLVRLVYPGLLNCKAPAAAAYYNITDSEWQDYLKLCIDYFIRYNNHVVLPPDVSYLLAQNYYSSFIYSSDCTLDKRPKRFPSLKAYSNGIIAERQNRIVLLLLAALGYTNPLAMEQPDIDRVNSLLQTAWNHITTNVLTLLDQKGSGNDGYKLDLFDSGKVALQIITQTWVCPVTGVQQDTLFRGISPLIKGHLNATNINRFKVTSETVNYPFYPYAYKRMVNSDGTSTEVQNITIIEWVNQNLSKQISLGLWSSLHERILLSYPVYLAAEHSAQQSALTLGEIEKDFNEGKINVLSCSTTMEMGVDIDEVSEVIMNNVPPKPANYLQRAGRGGRRSESKVLAVTFCSPNPIGMNVMKNPKWAMEHKTAQQIVNLDSVRVIQRHINSFLFSLYVRSLEGISVKSTVGDFFYTDASSRFNSSNFIAFLNLHLDASPVGVRYEKLIDRSGMKGIPLSTAILATSDALETVYAALNNRKTLLEGKKADLLREVGYTDKSPEIKAIDYQLGRLLSQNLIGFLAESDFLPSAGIPTGIVEFIKSYKTKKYDGNENNFFNSNPSLHVTQALSQYAPGNQIVLNEKCYTSEGILFKSVWSDANRAVLQSCKKCRHANLGNTVLENCPHCNTKLEGIQTVGSAFTEIIEPAGFSVAYHSEPTRHIDAINQNFIEPILLNMPPWADGINTHSKIDIRTETDHSEILYYNKGKGFGYAVCTHCGKAELESAASTPGEQAMTGHWRLSGGKKEDNTTVCSGNDNYGDAIRRNVLVGGRMQTDFIEIRFRDDKNELLHDEKAIWSLGVILTRKFVEYIGIDNDEVGFNVKHYPEFTSIFIFDTAKGGAGYSPLFVQNLSHILDEATRDLAGCNCESACTRCLIDRSSQWFMDKLDRKKALNWLAMERESRSIVPDNIAASFSPYRLEQVNTDIISQLAQVASQQQLKGITIFVSNEIKSWNVSEWRIRTLIDKLIFSGRNVAVAIVNPDSHMPTALELFSLKEAQLKYNFKRADLSEFSFIPIMQIDYTDATSSLFFSEDICTDFNEKWGDANSAVYKVINYSQARLLDWAIDFNKLIADDNKLLFEFKIKKDSVALNEFFNLLTKEYEANSWEKVLNAFRNSTVEINYTDIYLRSPLGCLLIAHFLQQMSTELNLKISNANFNFARFEAINSKGATLGNEFSDNRIRDEYIEKCCNEIANINSTTIEYPGKLPHWRELILRSKDCILVIRPHGGFLNEWRLQSDIKFDSNVVKGYDILKLANRAQLDGILYNVIFERTTTKDVSNSIRASKNVIMT